MNAFNLVLVADRAATFLTNHPRIERRSLAAGTHGLSNGGFDVPWPKTVRLQQALEQWLARGESDFGFLFEALRQETPAPGADGEPRLAPVFIRNPAYGTRCSTVLAIGRDGQGMIAERSFSPDGAPAGERTENFRWF